MSKIKIFIGYDSRFPKVSCVLDQNLKAKCYTPECLHILYLEKLWLENKFNIKINQDPLASTEFTYTRFLVPALMNYEGIAVFMDNDMLAYADILDMGLSYDIYYDLRFLMAYGPLERIPALFVRKHDYIFSTTLEKMYGIQQTNYPRKNWSSLMVMNCAKLKCWTPEVVAEANGARLHRFLDIPDTEIGDIEEGWNDLTHKTIKTKLLHYTEGGPWYKNYFNCPHAEDWKAAYRELYGKEVTPI